MAGLKVVQKDPENSWAIHVSLSDGFRLSIPIPIFSAEILSFIDDDVLNVTKVMFHEALPGHCLADIFAPVKIKDTSRFSLESVKEENDHTPTKQYCCHRSFYHLTLKKQGDSGCRGCGVNLDRTSFGDNKITLLGTSLAIQRLELGPFDVMGLDSIPLSHVVRPKKKKKSNCLPDRIPQRLVLTNVENFICLTVKRVPDLLHDVYGHDRLP